MCYILWISGKSVQNPIYRVDPIPYTGKGRIGYKFKNWNKRPKTTQERRLSFEYKYLVRGKRRAHILPTSWDDYQRGDVKTRISWKNKRIKKQWIKCGGRINGSALACQARRYGFESHPPLQNK